ncbi:MAG: glycoside hydrolase family 3 N-terminal domain-containing protein [Spirochaetales bacterium]
MINLKAKPFSLDDEAVAWVNTTLAKMTMEEKIGQLFVNMGTSRDETYLRQAVAKYQFGGVRYNPASAADIHEQNRILQDASRIPLLIAANTEAGGNGACTDGTEVGLHVKIGATGDPRYAYELGRVSGVEAAAVGCNWSFAPIVDIHRNWRNPIVSSRCFSQDADVVLAMGREYMRGIGESGIACAMKHFPGDGVDERDQHLSTSVNSMTRQEWDESFGKVYSGLIDAGIPSVMVGHILLPAHSKELLPATLSHELVTGLLKTKLGFQGVVVTDASHMVGLTGVMRRRDLVPAAIAAGCDLFLFFNDPDEDFGYMLEGYRAGVITDERLNDAMTRILGLKASLGLPEKQAAGTLVPPKQAALASIGLPANKALFAEVADKAITLVKNVGNPILPLTPGRYPRLLLVPVKGPDNPAASFFGVGKGPQPTELLAELLRAQGFEVTIFESLFNKILKLGEDERRTAVLNMYAGKAAVAEFTAAYDAVINVANVIGGMQPVERISWPASKGTPDIPWYVHELPTVFVSVACPFHLADAPQVKCYINTYDGRPATMELLVEKLLGRSPFLGTSPVDAFCGFVDTHL